LHYALTYRRRGVNYNISGDDFSSHPSSGAFSPALAANNRVLGISRTHIPCVGLNNEQYMYNC
jgi:hypothetical protein